MATRTSSVKDPAPLASAEAQGWAGGANLREVITQLQPNEARNIENLTLDEGGGVAKRPGCSSSGSIGVAADRIIALYTFYRGNNNAPQLLAHTSAGKLYYSLDPTANPAVWTQITTGLSTSAPMSFETFNSKVYMSNGTDAYASWDGSTYTTFGSIPKGKYIKLWKDTMWLSGVSGLSDRVYVSDPGNAESFGVASWVDIAKGDGDRVTALATDGLYLGVFKRNRTFLITDPVIYTNRLLDPEKGCESHLSVVTHENQVLFLSRKGICEFISDSPARLLSYKLDPLFRTEVINLGALDKTTSYVYGNRVGWAIPEAGSSSPSLIIEYYPRLGQLTAFGTRLIGPFVFHRFPATCFARWRSGNLDNLYGGHLSANKLLQIFAPVGTDDGASFASVLETVPFEWGAPTLTKYLRRIRFVGRGKFYISTRLDFATSVSKTYLVDMSSSAAIWNTGTWNTGNWGPANLIQQKLIDTDDFGRYIQLRITDSEPTAGTYRLDVGSKAVPLTVGEWALYGILLDAAILGIRP